MLLRHKLENTWQKYLEDVTKSMNTNYIYGSSNVTPEKAHQNKPIYDEKIRALRAKTRNDLPNDFKRQNIVIRKYLKSKKSQGKKIGNYVYLNFDQKEGISSKSFDFQVNIKSNYAL